MTRSPFRGPVFGVVHALLVATLLVLPGVGAAGADGPGPVTHGAYRAHAFAALPASPSIAVEVYDDSPDNLALKQHLEDELRAMSLRRDGVPDLVLAVDVRIVPIETGPQARARMRPAGVARYELIERAGGRVIWEAEAIFEAEDGDIPGGALALVPLVVDTLGKTFEVESLDLY